MWNVTNGFIILIVSLTEFSRARASTSQVSPLTLTCPIGKHYIMSAHHPPWTSWSSMWMPSKQPSQISGLEVSPLPSFLTLKKEKGETHVLDTRGQKLSLKVRVFIRVQMATIIDTNRLWSRKTFRKTNTGLSPPRS
jgi:hypothetical protein